ncbi:uncharacterized protein C8Q71DRAFT_857053 [Rhodofomes roseus]|uniref:Uncharacterized protein n=1 Tax=Rhodofomes roseus TaxID=34475 RepID=A0ABQ8KIT0_9APHY|nr:uncharacterized protein C8Q71DRAFT_857053 [Rhodofomes roseus]KAH9837876.1 hypothetical protein C8Q71DRAFT_857053 [Rhodofomes roseus]
MLQVSPSTLFAVTAILEGEPFVNSTPRDTFVPGTIQLATSGSDLKPGQTKLKSLSAELQFNSKESSKSSIVDDMADANHLLFKCPEPGANR